MAKGGWFWHELNTPNGGRAKTFYESLCGWGTADMPMPTGMYTLFQHGGTGSAGMAQTGGPGLENMPPMWLVYIETDDVEGDHQRVTELGGQAMTHVMEVPQVGRWFMAQDPTGAVFALMQPFPQPAAAAPAKPAKAKASPKTASQKPKPKGKALVSKVAKAKAKAATPPKSTASKKAHPRAAALKAAKKTAGAKASTKAARDTAASKRRAASLKGRSQLNFKR